MVTILTTALGKIKMILTPCPPYPYAFCTCGYYLYDHTLPEGADPLVSSNYLCVNTLTPGRRFAKSSDSSTRCEYMTYCIVCGDPLCPEHSNEFVACDIDSFIYHHTDKCERACPQCTRSDENDRRSAL